ncbi:MAG: hypothetical protein M3463_01685, partial [Verrucomicrobiota bacterium]|nr:hypothetical protein [Verrucomicrobiota bacterium]
LATIAHRLVALEIELDLALSGRSDRAKLLDDFTAAHRGGSKVELESLATWLLKRNQTQRVLDLLPPAVAAQSEVLAIVRLDALVAQGQIKEIQSDLESSNSPLSEAAKAVYRWFLATERGDTEGASAQWRAALAGGAENSMMLLGVAKYMERRGKLDLAGEAYSILKAQPNFAKEAYLGLLRIAQNRGDTYQMRVLIEEMRKTNPADPALRNDLAYLNLLLGRDLEGALQTAEQLIAEFPHLLAMRTTLALAYLRSKNPQAAKALYEGLTIDWAKATPSAKAVYVAVLRENGATDEAARFAATIRSQQLRPEERELASGVPGK